MRTVEWLARGCHLSQQGSTLNLASGSHCTEDDNGATWTLIGTVVSLIVLLLLRTLYVCHAGARQRAQ